MDLRPSPWPSGLAYSPPSLLLAKQLQVHSRLPNVSNSVIPCSVSMKPNPGVDGRIRNEYLTGLSKGQRDRQSPQTQSLLNVLEVTERLSDAT
ncbi:hypothetical protein EGR_07686 [Echinococcus granulosus]|uniref:Uncharacterized protein n=1 Tax=Echinococcus granulosus TaxID=6210 RepID=W6UVK7_ECHGR|nr:hypothetical protein EGR_07686 [Echinococcus granulosus]EUB57444.1 hypothetical protein EGR_07686 [Echinococcus granulosus]